MFLLVTGSQFNVAKVIMKYSPPLVGWNIVDEVAFSCLEVCFEDDENAALSHTCQSSHMPELSHNLVSTKFARFGETHASFVSLLISNIPYTHQKW